MAGGGGFAVDGVFDIECTAWDRFLLGAVLWTDGDYLETRDVDEWYDGLLSRGGTLWGHYAGYYDTLCACEVARVRGDRAICTCQGPRVASVKLRDGDRPRGPGVECAQIRGTQLRDSHALVPMPLADAALMGGNPIYAKGALPPALFGCDCGAVRRDKYGRVLPNGCGGYCRLRSDMSPAQWLAVREYLRGDCDALLYGCLLPLLDRSLAHGFPLRGTIGGTAMASVQAAHLVIPGQVEIPAMEWASLKTYHLVEQAKRGGRCEVYDQGPHAMGWTYDGPAPDGGRWVAPDGYDAADPADPETPGYGYDVQSAYPSAMEQVPVPLGEPWVVYGDRALAALVREVPGIYHVSVRVPEQHIPPLPTTVGGRPGYPWGRWSDAYALPELLYAVDHCGVVVEAVTWAVCWADTGTPLAPWMRHWWAERARATAAGPTEATWAKWIKWKLNSAIGKLGQDPRGETLVLNPDLANFRACPGTCPPRQHLCGAWRVVAPSLWAIPRWSMPPMGYLHWNCYDTAAQRVKLHAQLVDDGQGGETAWYADTDSCLAGTPRTRDIGHDLGQWHDDGRLYRYGAHAPKAYTYGKDNGVTETRLKGVPRASAADLRDYTHGVPVYRDDGVMGLRSAARAGDPGDGALWPAPVYPTKASALDALYAVNAALCDGPAFGGLDNQDARGFDAVNARYGLRGARRVTTLRAAFAQCVRGRVLTTGCDLDTLNALAADHDHGDGGRFRLPDADEPRPREQDPDAADLVPGRLFRRKTLSRAGAAPDGWVGSRVGRDGGKTRAPHISELRTHRAKPRG